MVCMAAGFSCIFAGYHIVIERADAPYVQEEPDLQFMFEREGHLYFKSA